MVHTRYTLEIINGIVGAIRALLRGRVFVRWFEKGYRSRRGGSGVEKGGDACVAQRARTSACRQDTLLARATQASPLHPAPPPPLRGQRT